MKLRSGTITSSIIGYKIAKAGEIRVVVTLEIPEDAITNMKRKDIVDINYAKHRTNKAKVVKIQDENGNQYYSAVSFGYDKKTLNYKLNDTIVINDYDMNLENVCSTGIHFFLTRRGAELYGLEHIENGLLEKWYDNGQKFEERTYVNGRCYGLGHRWHPNGQKIMECMYVNSGIHGRYQTWYEDGQKYEDCIYVNGKRHGMCHSWYRSGQKYMECTYVNGEKHGQYQRWYENGQKASEYTFVNGVPSE